MILVIITTKNFNFFTKQVEKSSKELSTIENEMSTLDEAHKKTAADVESTMLALETTSEQVRNRAWSNKDFTANILRYFLSILIGWKFWVANQSA